MANKKERVAIVSALASGSLAAAKLVVGVMIGSLALISDALHSVIDLGATLMTWWAVRVGDRPPDEEHHYGHGKIESVAALAETALLFLLAGGVAVEAVSRLQTGGTPVLFSPIAFVVLGIEMAINAWRARALLRVARETRSQALEADALHFASDFFGSIPVIIGLALAAYGYAWADPVAAIVVALLISVLGFRLGKRTIETLTDTAPPGIVPRIALVAEDIGGVVSVERVRARPVGGEMFVELTVGVSRTLPLDRVEAIKQAVADAITAEIAGAEATVTIEPRALDDETVIERIMVIARNRALAVHHVTVHTVNGRLLVAVDLEVGGRLTLKAAHDIADAFEAAVRDELGSDVEVETHIEPLQVSDATGRDADPQRVKDVVGALVEAVRDFGALRDVHDVRVRETDDGEIVNFHCRVDPALSVQAVHEMVDEAERALRRRMPQIKRVIGHAEPLPSSPARH
jgi:cation diffusion facilitator family transporter